MAIQYKPKSPECQQVLTNPKEFFELKIEVAMDKRAWDIPILERSSELLDVFAILTTNDHVWIVEDKESNRVIGVITEHDILHALRPTKRHRFFGMPSRRGMGIAIFETADHIMSHDPVTCIPTEKVKDVLRKMDTHGVRRCAVIESKSTHKILGEVTLHQLIREYYNIVKPLCVIEDNNNDTSKKPKK
jgi:CBS domain-containing protein